MSSWDWDGMFPSSDKTPVPIGVPAASDLQASIDDIKMIPPQELYRLIVDGQFHKEQKGWLGYAKREPNCLPACFNALELFAFGDITDPSISVELVKNIHKSTTENVKQLNPHTKPGELRLSHGGYFLEERQFYPASNMNKEGFLELYKKNNDESAQYGTCIISMTKQDALHLSSTSFYEQVEAMENSTASAEELWETGKDSLIPHVIFYRAPRAEHLNTLLDHVCQQYNTDIKSATTPEDKLKTIATVVQQVARLHAFPDANLRTSLILLQRLLLQNNFFPSMLYNPFYILGYSVDTLVDEIKKGINNTKTMIHHPEQPLYDYKTVRLSIPAPPSGTVFTTAQQLLYDTIEKFYLAQDKLHQGIQSLKPSTTPNLNK